TLSFVHERNEGVADFQFNRVYLKQVFHEVAAGRRALDNRLWPAACCLTPLTILCGCPCYQREQTRECDKRKLGQPRNQPEHCHHAGRNPQRTRTSAYLPGESCTHLRTTGHVRDHDAGRGGDDQRGDLRYESVSNREDRVARSSFTERHTALNNQIGRASCRERVE